MSRITLKHRSRIAAGLAAVPVTAALLTGCGSSPSSPHPWCTPMITQFHKPETQAAYLAGLTVLQQSGAPVGKLITDITVYAGLQDEVNSPGIAGYEAMPELLGQLTKIGADLQQLNRECGEPASAYKTDNA
jgi:hypothetical protein